MKKKITLAVLAFILIIFGVVAFIFFSNSQKISWDEKSENITTVAPSKVHLGLNIDEDKMKDVKVETKNGSIKINGKDIIWDLSEQSGVAKITVRYKKQLLDKTVTIAPYMIPIGLEQESSGFYINEDESDDADIDYDGLTNAEEHKLKTDKRNSDTDEDGLNDYEEVNTYKTDPLNPDTDNDGLTDYSEIQQGLDPLKADSRGDGVKDGDRTVEYSKEKDNLKITVTGKGNLSELTTNIEINTGLSNKYGMIDKLYSFKTEGKLKEANIEISYTDEEIADLDENNLSVFYYNNKEDKYEIVKSRVDTEQNKITAKLTHFSDYIVADKTKIDLELKNNVLFVLDNSWSMYSNEQYKEITGEEYGKDNIWGTLFGTNVLSANDSEGVRFKLTKELIEKLSGSDKIDFGLSEFRGDYANLNPVGSKSKDIYKNLEYMNGNFTTKKAGTNIDEAIRSGTNNLKECYGERYLVLLTDGEHNGPTGIDGAIEYAISYNVKIITIGFGEASGSKDLQEVAEKTGGEFYYSSNTDGLEDLFLKLETKISSDMVDIDGDKKADAVIIADSGFIPTRDGFNFSNYRSVNSDGGHCYGMALFAHLYYQDFINRKYEGGNSHAGWLGGLLGMEYELSPYEFTNKHYLTSFKPLYEYSLTNNLLKYTYGFEYFGEKNNDATIREFKDGKYKFTKEHRKLLKETGIYDIGETVFEGKTYEIALLNENKLYEKFKDHDDTQLIEAIIHYFNNQTQTKMLTNKMDFSGAEFLRKFFGITSEKHLYTLDGFEITNISELMINRLKNKEAFVLCWFPEEGNGGHAVNAIKLARDLNDPTIYYLYIYDNNYPGAENVLKYQIKNEKLKVLNSENYNLKNATILTTTSLDQDLSYFK